MSYTPAVSDKILYTLGTIVLRDELHNQKSYAPTVSDKTTVLVLYILGTIILGDELHN